MIDIKELENNSKNIKELLIKRNFDTKVLDDILDLNNQRKDLLKKLEKHSLLIKNADVKDIDTNRNLKQQQKQINANIKEVEESLKNLLETVPNIPKEHIPNEDFEVVFEDKKLKKNGFYHSAYDLLLKMELIDIDNGTKIAKSNFPVYRGLGADIVNALSRVMLKQNKKNGYEHIISPLLVNSKSMFGTGQLPKFEDDLFKLRDDDLWLIPTSEVSLTNLYAQQLISIDKLPIKLTSYTQCFRRESGSHGIRDKGIRRTHQFNKVELVKIVDPSKEEEELKLLLDNAIDIIKLLELPYRVILLPKNDLGFSSSITYDIEVWMPFEKKWVEVSSVSSFTDFQARRMSIKTKRNLMDKSEKAQLAYTMNGSSLAIDRIFEAIIENYQNDENSCDWPQVILDELL